MKISSSGKKKKVQVHKFAKCTNYLLLHLIVFHVEQAMRLVKRNAALFQKQGRVAGSPLFPLHHENQARIVHGDISNNRMY